MVIFMAGILYCYMRQRLIDVALTQTHVKSMNVGKVSLDAVESLGSVKYQVMGQSNPAQSDEVDITIGMCSCTKGENGVICKHQTACAEHSMTVVPQMFVLNSKNRQWLAVLAIGKEKAPDETFFFNLNENDNEEVGEVGASDMNSNREEATENNVMATENSVMVTEGRMLVKKIA